MKKIILLISCLIVAVLVNAQLPKHEWAKGIGGTLEDGGTSITSDGSGNVYISGYFQGTPDFDPGAGTFNLTSAGSNDIFILKLDASGNFVWAKKMGGTLDDGSSSIKVDALGNIYTTGYFSGQVDFDPGSGTLNLTAIGKYDIYISKLDASGNFVWAKNMGGIAEEADGGSLVLDKSGNVYTSGSFTGIVDFDPDLSKNFNLTALGDLDIFILKLDAAGNFSWAKQIGGESDDYLSGMALDGSGNIYTTGGFQDKCDFDPGSGTFYLNAVADNDIFISKLDNAGVFQWAKKMGGTYKDNGNSIAVDNSGNVYTTGFFAGSVDFDPNNDVSNLVSNGGWDIFISKLNSSGNFLWAKKMGSAYNDYGQAIALDGSGNVYLSGNFSNISDFDPGSDEHNLTSFGFLDIFVSKLDTAGEFVWARQMGGGFFEVGLSIAVDVSGNIYTTGNYNGISDFNPNSSIFNLSSLGAGDIFIHKMSPGEAGIKGTAGGSFVSIYPNPTNEILTIEFIKMNNTEVKIEVLNTMGQIVMEKLLISDHSSFNIQDLSDGLYVIRVLAENKIIGNKKIIKNSSL